MRTFSVIFSILLLLVVLMGCASVERPDAHICGVNSKSMTLRCYNIKRDFSNEGVRDPNAKPLIKAISSIHDLNGGIYLSPSDFEKVKVWLADLREYSKGHCR